MGVHSRLRKGRSLSFFLAALKRAKAAAIGRSLRSLFRAMRHTQTKPPTTTDEQMRRTTERPFSYSSRCLRVSAALGGHASPDRPAQNQRSTTRRPQPTDRPTRETNERQTENLPHHVGRSAGSRAGAANSDDRRTRRRLARCGALVDFGLCIRHRLRMHRDSTQTTVGSGESKRKRRT